MDEVQLALMRATQMMRDSCVCTPDASILNIITNLCRERFTEEDFRIR
jgi:hypothetical protein